MSKYIPIGKVLHELNMQSIRPTFKNKIKWAYIAALKERQKVKNANKAKV